MWLIDQVSGVVTLSFLKIYNKKNKGISLDLGLKFQNKSTLFMVDPDYFVLKHIGHWNRTYRCKIK